MWWRRATYVKAANSARLGVVGGGGTAVVDCHQGWCGPCKAMATTLRKIFFEFGERPLKMYTANVDQVKSLEKYRGSCQPVIMFYMVRLTAMHKLLRIVTLGLGTGRQKNGLERWTNPNLSRRTCTCEYGLQSCRGKSVGVANDGQIPNVLRRTCTCEYALPSGVAKRPRAISHPKSRTLRFATFATLYDLPLLLDVHRGPAPPRESSANRSQLAAPFERRDAARNPIIHCVKRV